MKTLIIVDVQVDFCPGGALPAHEGHKIVPVINSLMKKFDLILASRDWHPENTVHFGKWPPHCIRGTKGAEFHPDLNVREINKIFSKGTKDKDDGYSAFEATNEDLVRFLSEKNVTEVYISGLTTEYCVKSTALDSISNGFKTYVIKDAIAPVLASPGDDEKALKEMKEAGVEVMTSGEV
jgi:nicotinamidase/pyrazinamidase